MGRVCRECWESVDRVWIDCGVTVWGDCGESCESVWRDDAESLYKECGKIAGKVGMECWDSGEIILGEC